MRGVHSLSIWPRKMSNPRPYRKTMYTSHRAPARRTTREHHREEKEHWAWSAAKKVGKFAWDHRKYIPSWPGWLSRPPQQRQFYAKSYSRPARAVIRSPITNTPSTPKIPSSPTPKQPSRSAVLLAALRQIRELRTQFASGTSESTSLSTEFQQEQELQPVEPQFLQPSSGAIRSRQPPAQPRPSLGQTLYPQLHQRS